MTGDNAIIKSIQKIVKRSGYCRVSFECVLEHGGGELLSKMMNAGFKFEESDFSKTYTFTRKETYAEKALRETPRPTYVPDEYRTVDLDLANGLTVDAYCVGPKASVWIGTDGKAFKSGQDVLLDKKNALDVVGPAYVIERVRYTDRHGSTAVVACDYNTNGLTNSDIWINCQFDFSEPETVRGSDEGEEEFTVTLKNEGVSADVLDALDKNQRKVRHVWDQWVADPAAFNDLPHQPACNCGGPEDHVPGGMYCRKV